MSRTNPWIKFYPADWQSDERLGMCSLAARGLWMEMLALMHRADPYGHLLVNGMKPSDVQLAALARASADQIRELTQELESAGVFSRTRTGTIYSRRMTHDDKKRDNGRNGASVTLEETEGISGSGTPQKPEAIYPNKEDKSRKRVSYPDAFDQLWKAYPTDANMSKLEAFKAWERLSDEDRALCLESVPAFRVKCEADSTYRPVHLVRYINQRRFDGFVELARKIASHEELRRKRLAGAA